MTWILIAILALTPVQALMELEGLRNTETDSPTTQESRSSSVANGPHAYPTSTVPPSSESSSSGSSEQLTVTEDDQGDIVVSHPDEPFTYTVEPGRITVTPAIHTSVHIFVHPWPVTYDENHFEASYDQPTTFAELTFPLGCVKYSIVVIVNNDDSDPNANRGQVSNLEGTVGCS